MVMEKSWNMRNWQKVIVFCDHSWNFINFVPRLCNFVCFDATTKKSSIDIKSLHFQTFSAKRCKCKIKKRDGHVKIKKWSWKSHGKNVVKSGSRWALL